jgi:predicted short-subunit dehydrogenase-like oxidoreductase (DUF2520 family)
VNLGSHKVKQNPGVAIIGLGRIGPAIGKLLANAGVPVRFLIDRNRAKALQAARFIGEGRPLGLADSELSEARIFLLSVSDVDIAPLAERLVALHDDWHGKVVLHTCGSLPAAILQPLKRRGAAIGSLHPFQTIPSPKAGIRSLKGTFWGIEGNPEARTVAQRWVKAFHGTAFRVDPRQKALYHLAACLVCPTTVMLMDRAVSLLRRAGISAKVARPMLGQFVAETARNFVELGARRALTGPAARGDWATIRRHLVALKRASPATIPVYKELVRAMLPLARRRPPRSFVDLFSR